MGISTRITERLCSLEVLWNPVFAYKGLPRLGLYACLKQQHQNFAGVCANVALCLKSYDDTSRNKTGFALPATKEFAKEAIRSLKSGKIIAGPLILYMVLLVMLVMDAFNCSSTEALNRIYEIKGRKLTSLLAICVGDVSDIKWFAVTDHLPETLFDALLPGPVTLVLRRVDSSNLEKSLNPGVDSIDVQVPDNDFIRIIARGTGSALALTSANLSGHLSSVYVKDFENLWEHCAYVFDGGELPMGRAGSTIVDLTSPRKIQDT